MGYAKMNCMGSKELSAESIAGLASALAIAVLSFLPWATFGSRSVTGIDLESTWFSHWLGMGDGEITFLLACVSAVSILVASYSLRPSMLPSIALAAGLMISLMGVQTIVNGGGRPPVPPGVIEFLAPPRGDVTLAIYGVTASGAILAGSAFWSVLQSWQARPAVQSELTA